MEAIYLGNAHWQGNTGAGKTGPWVGADLEAGMYYVRDPCITIFVAWVFALSIRPRLPCLQGGGEQTKVNPQNKPLTSDFVSLHLKGRTDGFALKGGDATKGAFQTMYDGPRPTHASAPNNCHWHGVNGSYQPMRKQGAIILGTGGDNSNGAVGNFYEVRSALSCATYGNECSVLSDSRPSGVHGERGHLGGDRRQDQGEHCRRGLQAARVRCPASTQHEVVTSSSFEQCHLSSYA